MARAARYGVLGWPVAHSRSPAMMTAAGLDYQRLPVAPELLAETVRALPAAGFAGANVTIPHKEAALGLADTASPAARAIGAANTLVFAPDGAIHAENTDAPGLIVVLGEPVPASALVLGAGGSARAAVWALRAAGADVAVWNRTPARAATLGARTVSEAEPSDVLVNCTSVGLDDSSSPFVDLPLDAGALGRYPLVVDLVYRSAGTELILEARRLGARTVDGLDVLVAQGALSYTAWTGRPAPLEAMRAAVRDAGG